MVVCITSEHDLWYVDLPDSDADFIVDIGNDFGSLCYAISFIEGDMPLTELQEAKRLRYLPELERLKQLVDYCGNPKNYVKGPPSVVYYE